MNIGAGEIDGVEEGDIGRSWERGLDRIPHSITDGMMENETVGWRVGREGEIWNRNTTDRNMFILVI